MTKVLKERSVREPTRGFPNEGVCQTCVYLERLKGLEDDTRTSRPPGWHGACLCKWSDHYGHVITPEHRACATKEVARENISSGVD